MVAWNGALVVSKEEKYDGLVLSSSNNSSPLGATIAPGHLEFLTFIETSRVPFYLAAGPSLQVETNSENATAWFTKALLHERFEESSILNPSCGPLLWFETDQLQSNIGILARTQTLKHHNQATDGPRITEVLFYAIKARATGSAHLLTPPPSSPQHHDHNDQQESNLTPGGSQAPDSIILSALPLSSDLLYEPTLYSDPDLHQSRPDGQAQFLPTPDDLHQRSQLTRKRDQLEGLFDGAPDRKKKAKRLHMESLSQADARTVFPQKSTFEDSTIIKTEARDIASPSTKPGAQQDARARPKEPPARHLSRSPSLPATRPASSKGPPMLKRSSLSQLTTSKTLDDASVEARNKAAVSRTVMAGMRMFGLVQARRRERRTASVGSVGELSQLQGLQRVRVEEGQTQAQTQVQEQNDEEFKGVYHQTFKGTLFAFRHSITDNVLAPDAIGEVVDRLLGVFCSDPP